MIGAQGKMSPGAASDALRACLEQLKTHRWVDLTHDFHPLIPHSSCFEAEQRVTLYHYDEGVGVLGTGFLSHQYRLAGQWGTHVDPPSHFVRGLRSQDQIPVTEMILPLVVLDISERAARDPDAVPTLSDLDSLEERAGSIPADSFVALRTGWDRRWPDAALMKNEDSDGVGHSPGWSQEVLAALDARGVLAIGHDVTDTDPGFVVSRGEAPLEAWWLGTDRWQLELMANLGEVPALGALIVATWPKPYRGSGFPARAFAICPGERP